MSLIGKMIGKLLRQGTITLIGPDGKRETCGAGGGRHLTIRFTDRRVPLEIIKNPRLGMGEAYMDGRVIVEDGTVLDLLEMITSSNRWEDGGKGRKIYGKSKLKQLQALIRRNDPRRSRRNVAH